MKTLVEFLARLPAVDPRPDDALLAAFRDGRDDAAFARLVQRHGPLVWGVCRRHLSAAHAEDAFQATFLAAVRHLDRLSGPLGPWLHAVATRTALALRRRLARRACEALGDVAEPPESSIDVDALLLALPEKCRAAVVLCYLAGHTQQEAADRLGCPVGTLSARLSRGLAMLRERGAGERSPPTPSVPLALSAATARLAAAVQAGSLAAAAPHLVSLIEGVNPMRWMTKAALAALVAITAVTAFALATPRAEPRRAYAPVPKEEAPKDGLIALWNLPEVLLLRPDGRVHRRLKRDYPGDGRFLARAPGGERLAVLAHDDDVALGGNTYVRAFKLSVRGLDGKGPAVDLPADGLSFRGLVGWSADGKRLYAIYDTVISEARNAVAAGKKPPHAPDRAVVFDVAAKKRTLLPLPAGHWLLGERPDGKLVTTAYHLPPKGGGGRAVFLSAPDGGGLRMFDLDPSWPMAGNDHLSPDGRRVLSVLFDDAKSASGLGVMDTERGTRTWLRVTGLPEKHFFIERARWSPDGKMIAFYYLTLTEGREPHWSRWPRGPEAKLCVIDADGKNLKVIREGPAEPFHYFEWK